MMMGRLRSGKLSRDPAMAEETAQPFRVLEHTADVGFEAFGRTREEVFANAARALEDLIVPLETVRALEETTLKEEGRHDASLLVNWLSELVYRFDVEGRLYREFEVREVRSPAGGRRALTACARGEAFDRSRHEVKVQVKAITYHQVLFEKTSQPSPGVPKAAGWHARVYVDI